jgi:hypothetical protein
MKAALFTTEPQRSQREFILARSGDPPASPERLAMAGRRRSGKRTQPFGRVLQLEVPKSEIQLLFIEAESPKAGGRCLFSLGGSSPAQ